MLELKNIRYNKEYYKAAKELYLSAFPSAERMPFRVLYKKANCSSVCFFAVTEDGDFKGIAYTVWHRDIVFLFYLAVAPQWRGKGVGSEILGLLKKEFDGCRFVLNIEQTDDSAPNNAERQKRREFYLKNGYVGAGYAVKEYSVTYENLYSPPDKKPVTQEEYFDLMRAYLGKPAFDLYRFISK